MPERKYALERVGSVQVAQVYADGFENLSLRQKLLAYYLSRAAIAGHSIILDQLHRHGLEIRELFEEILLHPEGIDGRVLEEIKKYIKLFWAYNGMYELKTSRKLIPGIGFGEFSEAVRVSLKNGASFKMAPGETFEEKLERLKPFIFNQDFEPILTNKMPGADWLRESANNFYQGVSLAEVEEWAKAGKEKNPLNSRVVKEGDGIVEEVWRAGGEGFPPGLYAKDLRKVIYYLKKAIPYASSEYQKETIRLLIRYLRTGSPEDFRRFNIHWVKDDSDVDFILGFIEAYGDPRAQKGAYEGLVFFTDPLETEPLKKLAVNALYFEEGMPWDDCYKNQNPQTKISRVVKVVVMTGDVLARSSIGVNLPNEEAIRSQHGSKSFSLVNRIEVTEQIIGLKIVREFAYDDEEVRMMEKYGRIFQMAIIHLHEVLGHGSGKVSEHLAGDPAQYLPGYYNTLEEAKAELVALWTIFDQKLIELGLIPNEEVAKVAYQAFARLLLVQLRMVPLGDKLSNDHMKARQLLVSYVLENSDAISVEKVGGKTFIVVRDFKKMREAIGRLLAEVMRIKAEGDLPAAQALIDKYGLKINTEWRDEVLARMKVLDLPIQITSVMPKLELVRDQNGEVIDVAISYSQDFTTQMLEYSKFD